MNEPTQPTPTPPRYMMGKTHPHILALNLVHWLVVMGVTVWITSAQLWPTRMFIDWHVDADGMYPSNLVFMETLAFFFVCAYPIHWIIKKIIEKKITPPPYESLPR